MTGNYLYYNLAAALIMITLAAGWATYYWRLRMKAQRKLDKERLSVDLFKANVARESVAKEARNNHDMMSGVLAEVKHLQEGIDSLLQLLTSTDMTPGREEYNLTCAMIKQKSLLLEQLLSVALELMQYENRKKVDANENIVVNDFCHDVFESCLYGLNEGVETEMETSLDDDYTLKTDTDTLRRILQNLLMNSVSNTRKGSIKLKIGEDKKKRQLLFSVRDTAPAIPPQLQGKIFNRFPKDNMHQMLMTLRVRASKLMVKLLGGTMYIDFGYEKGVSVVFTVAMPQKNA